MKRIRYGIIGVKGFGKYHCHFLLQNKNAELVALVDIDREFVMAKSEELGVKGFSDYRDLLDAGIVDAVSIVTPHHSHATIALECLGAGVHAFVEKPIANRVSEADRMIEVARRNKLKLCVGHQKRLFKTSRVLKHLVDTGEIGNILRVLWSYGEFRSESYYESEMWRSTWRHAGGGVLTNQVSHDLDLICWLIGEPVQVNALVGNQIHRLEVEDIACANTLFRNGALGSLQFTVNQPMGYSVRQISGDKGIIVMSDVQSLTFDRDDEVLLGIYQDGLSSMLTQLRDITNQSGISWSSVSLAGNETVLQRSAIPRDDGPEWKKSMKFRRIMRRLGLGRNKDTSNEHTNVHRPDPFAILLNSFIDAIINGGEPIVNGESALPALELINAIVLSAIRKKTVDLPLDREEYDQLFGELARGEARVPRLHQ